MFRSHACLRKQPRRNCFCRDLQREILRFFCFSVNIAKAPNLIPMIPELCIILVAMQQSLHGCIWVDRIICCQSLTLISGCPEAGHEHLRTLLRRLQIFLLAGTFICICKSCGSANIIAVNKPIHKCNIHALERIRLQILVCKFNQFVLVKLLSSVLVHCNHGVDTG